MKRRLLLWALAISILRSGVSSGRAAAFDVGKFPVHPLPREMREENDPTDQQACDSMGQISISYKSGNAGPPSVGLRHLKPGRNCRLLKVFSTANKKKILQASIALLTSRSAGQSAAPIRWRCCPHRTLHTQLVY